ARSCQSSLNELRRRSRSAYPRPASAAAPCRDRRAVLILSQAFQSEASDSGRRLIGDCKNRAYVDFAKHVGVFARSALWSIKKICLPDDWKRISPEFEDLHHLRRPLSLHLRPQGLKLHGIRSIHITWPRLCSRCIETFGRRRD